MMIVQECVDREILEDSYYSHCLLGFNVVQVWPSVEPYCISDLATDLLRCAS